MSENHPFEDSDYEEEEGDYSGDGSSYEPTVNPPAGHPRKVLPKTAEQYLSYVKTLRKQFLASSPEAHHRDVLPIDLVEYLISRAPHLRPKTFINYRCGLLYWLGTLQETSETHHARLVLQVGVPKSGYKGPKPRSTSSLYSSRSSRPRTFERRRFNRLIAELTKRSAPTEDSYTRRRPSELMVWLHAGLASGLRPVEWATAKWLDREKGELLVKTAKRKTDVNALPVIAGLPPPPEKERIVQIDPNDRIWVEQHLVNVRRHLLSGEPFESFYNNNRVYLWSVCRDLFGEGKPPFTLYMMRGQFAANRKRRGIPIGDVAASMGCAPRVSSTYYGKRQYGHSSVMPETQVEANTDAQAPAKPRFSFSRQPTKAGVGS